MKSKMRTADDKGKAEAFVYANVPPRERAAFLRWNPNPIGDHKANLKNVVADLQKVVDRAEQLAKGIGIEFVVGSGRRTPEQQAEAVRMGWSLTHDSKHLCGRAVDLWILDDCKCVTFTDTAAADRLAGLMKRAATEVGVEIAWGGDNTSFVDRPHFELVGQVAKPSSHTL